jgi:hypothetical protein
MSWFSIISLSNFFEKPTNPFEDKADRLSSWIATSFMLTCCAIASAGLVVGNHFECMMPANYNAEWQSFMFSYCYVQPHFYSARDDDIRDRQIHFFPWLPYFFFFHALAFCAPLFLWKIIAGRFSIEIESVLFEVEGINKTVGKEKEERIARLATHMSNTLGFNYGGKASKYFLFSTVTLLFLLKKWLYVILACAQLYAICSYIGHGDWYWGFKVVSHSFNKMSYLPSEFFPLFTFCKVPIAEDNSYGKKVVSCVLGMNVIYEKLYIFMYFLLMIISIVSFASAVYYTVLFATPFRYHVIDRLLGFKNSLIPYKQVKAFTHNFLGADGFLAIILIRPNDVSANLLKELWKEVTIATR